MKRAYCTLFILLLLGISVGHAAAQSGGDYKILSSTIEGGGSTAKGSDYELNGTVGQADVGVATGGDFILSQGYWQQLTNTTPTAVHLNTASASSNAATLLSLVLLTIGGTWLTLQLRAWQLKR